MDKNLLNQNGKLKVFSMYAGIGGFELGISKALKQECTVVGFSEIDRFASAIYKYHYPEHINYGDATQLVCESIPDFDLLTGGFPCQSFSIAGKRQGFNEARGTLFFEIARILSHKRPRYFLLENVKGLLSHDSGKTYIRIIGILADLGYFVETIVLNSKDFGVPQNRERIFFIGHLAESGRSIREILSFGDGSSETVPTSAKLNLSGTLSTKNQSGQCNFDGSTTLIDEQARNPKKQIVGKDISAALDSNYHKGAGRKDLQKGKRQMIFGNEGLHRSDFGGGMGAKTGLYLIEDKHDGTKTKRNTNSLLQALQSDNGTKKRQKREVANNPSFSQADVLQQGLHESQFQRQMETYGSEETRELQSKADFSKNGDLRSVRNTKENGDSPQRRKQTEQRVEQLTRGLPRMSHADASQTTNVQSAGLQSDSSEIRLLRKAQSEVQEVGQSVDGQTQSALPSARIRRLTVIECERLQAFPDEWSRFGLMENGEIKEMSDSARYKCLGNAVTVSVIAWLVEKILIHAENSQT